MSEIRIPASLDGISADDWNRLFPGDPEDYAYLTATEKAGIAGFAFFYVTLYENGRLTAAMPGFLTDYALDTTLQGTGKKIASGIRTVFPRLLTVKLACLGSPCTETGNVGFAPWVPDSGKPAMLDKMLAAFERYGREKNCRLSGVKDIPETVSALWKPCLHANGLTGIPSLPTALLDIDFTSEEEYFGRLSPGTRKDMRRKLKSFDTVRVETAGDLTGILPRIMELYHDTRDRSEWRFEELTADYFGGILAEMPGHSACHLYYIGDRLLAANLVVYNNDKLLDKFFCMDGTAGREHNLYFLSWFVNIRFCLERGIKTYQSGQAYYDNKLRLGSRLIRNDMYFKHANFMVQAALKRVAPLFAVEAV